MDRKLFVIEPQERRSASRQINRADPTEALRSSPDAPVYGGSPSRCCLAPMPLVCETASVHSGSQLEVRELFCFEPIVCNDPASNRPCQTVGHAEKGPPCEAARERCSVSSAPRVRSRSPGASKCLADEQSTPERARARAISSCAGVGQIHWLLRHAVARGLTAIRQAAEQAHPALRRRGQPRQADAQQALMEARAERR